MSDPTVLRTWIDDQPIYVYTGQCCRKWPLAFGFPVGKCGLCGEKPVAIDEPVLLEDYVSE